MKIVIFSTSVLCRRDSYKEQPTNSATSSWNIVVQITEMSLISVDYQKISLVWVLTKLNPNKKPPHQKSDAL